MSDPLALLRPDLRGFSGYQSARTASTAGSIWLNANESAWPNGADPGERNLRYPDGQPAALRHALAQLYGCRPEQLLIGRGSDEAIDLLVRATCTAGQDAVLVTPPVFGMYAVSARLQDARLVEVPLEDGPDGLAVNFDAVLAAAQRNKVKLVFLCSPLNPAGSALPTDAIRKLTQALHGQALVVVDEAYGEYSTTPSCVAWIDRQPNLLVLRTLSKAHALAAARIGCVLGAAQLIAALRSCQAPYPVPTPCTELALEALSPASLKATERYVAATLVERERLAVALRSLPGVVRVYPSEANFLLVRFADAAHAHAALLAGGVVVRDQRHLPQLADALRISIGRPDQNDAVLAALKTENAT